MLREYQEKEENVGGKYKEEEQEKKSEVESVWWYISKGVGGEGNSRWKVAR